jgi:transcriptional antiterminator
MIRMMKDHAKFTGEIAKGIKIGESSVEVKLLIPLKAALPHLLFLSSNQGEEVNVFLGDPQAAFDFSEEDEVYREVTGRRVTTDASGIVMSTEKLGEEDPDQADLFKQQEGASNGEQMIILKLLNQMQKKELMTFNHLKKI